ncbi:MAG: hypothetical protein NZ889_00250 [Candidatus Pacearchaeota archaeon]|nr:hypothetical protein [Candidatus Pacearchaeota archaeon]
MKNKKAITFGVTFVLVTLLAIGVALYLLTTTQKEILKNTITAKKFLEIEQEKERIKVYMKKALELAESQTLNRMANTSFVKDYSECMLQEGKIVWEENCKPRELKEWFSRLFCEEFSKIMERYPKKLNFSCTPFETIELEVKIEERKENAVNYSFLSEIKLNFTESINLQEMENLYNQLKECEEENCFKKIQLKDWDLYTEKKQYYFFVDIESKKKYLLIKENVPVFEKIKIRVAIKLK